MLTLDTRGKNGSDAVDFVRDALDDNEDEFRILIDGPSQSEGITRFLAQAQGGFDVLLEDDDGTLFLMATRRHDADSDSGTDTDTNTGTQDTNTGTQATLRKNPVLKDSSAVVISYENRKYMPSFAGKFIVSITESDIRPDVIALMNNAVSLAAYNSPYCDSLRELESSGVEVLISDSCADRLGITESLGTGILADMREIIERIFSCEKVVSL